MRGKRKRLAFLALAVILIGGCASEEPARSPIAPATSGEAGPSAAAQASAVTGTNTLDPRFVYVCDVIRTAQYDIRYYGEDNFVGARIDGYNAPKAILTAQCAEALKGAADDLARKGYTIKIYDAYRPQKAVGHFVRWAKDTADVKMKAKYYPDIEKARLFELGYLAEKSPHSRGSAVDLTLVKDGTEVDMGGIFDYFGPVSAHYTALITQAQAANRSILRDAMLSNGFKMYSREWWHYTLIDEPYKNTYFDFDVE